MPKALITNRIYLDNPGPDISKKIIKELTYKFTKNIGSSHIAPVEIIKNYKVLPKGILSIPQARIDLVPSDYNIIDKRVQQDDIYIPKPVFELFPEQLEVFDKVIDTSIINALVGWGKSYTALWIAYKLRQKTLIITHNLTLRQQWEEDVRTLFGIEPGIIGSGKVNYEDYAITVSNTQTLIKHAEKVSKEFGLVILDECHHTPASTFSDILSKSHSRYRLGLSGTLIRKDNKHILFRDYFGSVVYTPGQSNTLTPSVKLVNTRISLDSDLPWTARITKLVENVDYQKFIADTAKGYMAKGYCVLVVADRTEFLRIVSEQIGDKGILITGTVGDRVLAKQQILSGEKDCVIGSRSVVAEGWSVNRLSCLILAVPINNDSLLEQLIGRIQRKFPEGVKLDPVVIDMQFKGYADRAQNDSRLGLYLRKGWKVETI